MKKKEKLKPNIFGDRIRTLCAARGSQEAFAREIGVACHTVGQWANGHQVPKSRMTLDAIAQLEAETTAAERP